MILAPGPEEDAPHIWDGRKMKRNQTKKSMRYIHGASFLALAASGAFHLIGVLAVFAVVMGLTLSPQVALSVMETSLSDGALRESLLWRMGIQLGLAGCFWTMGYLFYCSVSQTLAARRVPRLIRRAYGTVVTETLIVMPVLLLLIFGLAQLSINNIAGILSHVASFQAARTVWVWEPESVSDAELEERVRVAVAAVMAPVASGNMPAAYQRDLGARAQAMSSLMTERFKSLAGGGVGAAGASTRQSIVEGLDGNASHTARATRKFTQAYRSVGPVELTKGQGGAAIGATMAYQHYQAMPLVGRIFGKNISGNYYHELTIGMEIPSQLYGVGRPAGW